MTNTSKNKGRSFGGFKGFFNYFLSEADKTAVKSLDLDSEAVVGRILDLLARGYKISVSAPKNGVTYFVTATGKGAECANADRALTMRHSGLEVAISALWHVIAVVYDFAEWPEEEEDLYDW